MTSSSEQAWVEAGRLITDAQRHLLIALIHSMVGEDGPVETRSAAATVGDRVVAKDEWIGPREQPESVRDRNHLEVLKWLSNDKTTGNWDRVRSRIRGVHGPRWMEEMLEVVLEAGTVELSESPEEDDPGLVGLTTIGRNKLRDAAKKTKRG